MKHTFGTNNHYTTYSGYVVAEKLGLREETIWRWSTDWGVGGMRLASAERLANVLGCKVKDLFEE